MLRGRQRRTASAALVAVVLVLAVVGTVAVVGAQSSDTPTQAPDLQKVTINNANANDGQATATFTFDQNIDFSGSTGNFELIPMDGGPPLVGQASRGQSENTITIRFDQDVSASDIARGVVKSSTVTVAGEGDETNNPLESADVSNSGNSANPDLVNVTRNDSSGALIYAFDEPVNVESDSGFQAYSQNAKEFGGNVATPSQVTPRLVKVTFDDFDTANAVGASVTQGAVSSTKNTDSTNDLDEVPLSSASPPRFTTWYLFSVLAITELAFQTLCS